MSEQIIQAVGETIKALKAAFEETPTLFYTETDLVCWFTENLNGRLGAIRSARDREDRLHRLVHTEYPTPFRCDMARADFRVVGENDRTPKDGRYRRGHLDIVVLNPAFVRYHTYAELKAQNWTRFRVIMNNWGPERLAEHGPMLLYAIEFYFARDDINRSSKSDPERGARGCAGHIIQDAKKLVESQKSNYRFVNNIQHMAFIKGTGAEVRAMIKRELTGREEIMLVFGT